MCKYSDALAYGLFSMQYGERERRASGGRFSLRRGKDFTIAYSYSTPIAVYPDKGGFVLLDSSRFSNTTSRHQGSIRQVAPYVVRCIECDWLGQNVIWDQYLDDCFASCFKKFARGVVKEILSIGKDDSDYAYSKNRKETLNRLQRLRELVQLPGTPKCLLSRLDKREAAVLDPKRILAAQKRAVKKRKKEEERRRHIQEEVKLHTNLYICLETYPPVREAISKAADALLTQTPYSEWGRLRAFLIKPPIRFSSPLWVRLYDQVTRVAHRRWKEQCPGAGDIEQMCDLCWNEDGAFYTSKGFVISYAELQHCLKLWKSGQFLGKTVANRYRVLRNDESMLTIGCHCFTQNTVQRIWERYANKSPEQIAREEETWVQGFKACLDDVLVPLEKLVMREYNRFITTTETHIS